MAAITAPGGQPLCPPRRERRHGGSDVTIGSASSHDSDPDRRHEDPSRHAGPDRRQGGPPRLSGDCHRPTCLISRTYAGAPAPASARGRSSCLRPGSHIRTVPYSSGRTRKIKSGAGCA
ncbi:hypothetical protein Q0Z83_069970 [Actinoplanes sichuanensis]|nr:hypothetical protein Q0Z83_069970 [Actinoplanes sichuanensis]